MEHASAVTIETFLAVAEMVAAQLRIKASDRWTVQICQLKYGSFRTEFPEVSDAQFLWAAEQWLQSTNCREFLRYPSWKELMAPLYRSENGLANRSWGFKSELPSMVAPTPQQVEMLPATRRSIAGVPDTNNARAYLPFQADGPMPALPPAATASRKEWATYLNQLAESDGATDQQEQSPQAP